MRMKLVVVNRTSAVIFSLLWVLERGQTLSEEASVNGCTEGKQNCVRPSYVLFNTLLLVCTFVGIALASVVLCCYCNTKKRPSTRESKRYIRNNVEGGSCQSLSRAVAQDSVLKELNQRLHANCRDSPEVSVSAKTVGVKLTKQSVPVIAEREKQQKLARYDSKPEPKGEGSDNLTSSENARSVEGSEAALEEEVKAPQLPQRLYLKDMEFITKEYDLMMCHHPKRPEKSDRFSKGAQIYDDLMVHMSNGTKSHQRVGHGDSAGNYREKRRSTLSMVELPHEYDVPFIPADAGEVKHRPGDSSLPRNYKLQVSTATAVSPSTMSVVYDEVGSRAKDESTMSVVYDKVGSTGKDESMDSSLAARYRTRLRKSLSYDTMWQYQQQCEKAQTVYQNIGTIQKENPLETSHYQPLLTMRGDENPYMEVDNCYILSNT